MVSNTKNVLKTLDMKLPSEYSNNPGGQHSGRWQWVKVGGVDW